MADPTPDISIVIPNWNGRELLGPCLDSVRQTSGELKLQIIVVDNASSDASLEFLRAHHPEVQIIASPRNEGFACACNRGIAASEAAFALLLNTDTIVQPMAFQHLLALAQSRPEIGLVGVQLRNADGSFQSSHVSFPTLGLEWMILSGVGRFLYGPAFPSPGPELEKGPQRVDWIGGACMLVRRAAATAVGGFDEGFFMYGEEMDLCYRLDRAGWQVWYEPAAVVVHLGGASTALLGPRREAKHYRSRIRFHRLHSGPLVAGVVRWMIYGATAVKVVVHGGLRWLSGGRRGRRVVSLAQLRAELDGV